MAYGRGAAAVKAIEDVSLGIRQGEFMSIMGPSGAGKSTLLHILGMHDGAWTGEFDFLEQSVHKLGRKERQELLDASGERPIVSLESSRVERELLAQLAHVLLHRGQGRLVGDALERP